MKAFHKKNTCKSLKNKALTLSKTGGNAILFFEMLVV